MSALIKKIISPNPISIQGELRTPPRSKDEMERDYMDNFDASTMWYDVFSFENTVIALGPPLMNQWPKIMKSSIYAGTNILNRIPEDFEIRGKNKCYWLSIKSNADKLKLITSDGEYDIDVSGNETESFRDRRVLLVKSKNNKLNWVKDWVMHHVKRHKADAILFYDNQSTDYTSEDILEMISAIDGIHTAIVVKWDFPYGVNGFATNLWDSDYSQYCILEHARRRFLYNAKSVLSCDIDELIITENNASIFEMCENSETGYLKFEGKWIECCDQNISADNITHFDHKYIVKNSVCPTKWVVVPSMCTEDMQWRVHDVSNMIASPSEKITFLHFKCISVSWKYKRTDIRKYDPEIHSLESQIQRIIC